MKKYLLVIQMLALCFSLRAQWQSTGGPIGGVYSLYLSGSELYAAGYESFFRSVDGGAWERITIGDKTVTVTCFTEFGRKIYVGTQSSGIYYSSDGKNWLPIQNNDKLQDSLRVSAITAVGVKLLANVYHIGSHGNHSRIYEFEEEGRNLKQAIEFNTHLYVYSFTRSPGSKVLIATDKGIFIYDLSTGGAQWLSGNPTVQIVNAGTSFFGVPQRTAGRLYQWTNEEEYGSWYELTIGLDEYITNLTIRPEGLYATTYNGIYFSAINKISDPWSRIDGGISSDFLYVSSIAFQDPDKYVATNKGVFKSQGDGVWSSFNENLSTSYVYSVYVHDNLAYAGTANGLFRSPLGTYNWEHVPHDLFKLPSYTTHFASIGDFLFIGTDNGILRSDNNAEMWKEVHHTINLPGNFGSFYSQWFRVKSLVSSGNSLFTATYETPYASSNLGETWNEVSSGLPANRIIEGLRVIGDQIYLLLQEYPAVHDVWYEPVRSSIYRLNKASGSWNEIITHAGNSYYFFPAVLGKKLIFLHQKDGIRTLRSIDTDNVSRGVRELSLPDTESWAISNVLVLKENIFITTYTGGTFVSFDEGNSWEVFEALPEGVRSITTMFEKDDIMYAGLSGQGVWRRLYAEFFLPQVSISATSNITARSVSISGVVSATGNHPVSPFFEYALNEDFDPIIGSVIGTPALVNNQDQTVSASIKGLEANTDYHVRLRGTIAENLSTFSDTTFRTLDYLDASGTVVRSIDADADTHKVTEETAASKPIVLTLTKMVDSVAVTLHTRSLTDDEWKSTTLTSSNATYNVPLPHDQFDELGLEYYFTIVPPYAFRDPKHPEIKIPTSKIAVNYPTGVPFNDEIQFGSTAQDYNFISFPLNLSDTDIESILDDVLGDVKGKDDKLWRFLTYVGENGSYKEVWDEYPATRAKSVSPGRGYWLAVARELGTKLIKTGAGETVVHFSNSDSTCFYDNDHFKIKLRPGYNQIGNPFTYRIKWSDVQAVNDPVVGDLITFEREDGDLIRDNQNAILEPFSGGYVFNSSASDIWLEIPVKKNRSINGGRVSESDEIIKNAACYVGFTIRNGHRICKLGGLGIIDDASEGIDLYDLTAPPSPGNFPSITFYDDQASSFVRSLVPPQGEGQQWNFEAKSVHEDQETSISWSTLKIPPGNELWLHDLSNESLTNMVSADHYKFNGSRNFRVYYGSPGYIEKNIRPEHTVLHVYPNPVTDDAMINFTIAEDQDECAVRFSLIDLKGRKVYLNEGSKYNAGFHSLEWNVLDNHLESGLYLLEMEVNSQTTTKVYYKKVMRQ